MGSLLGLMIVTVYVSDGQESTNRRRLCAEAAPTPGLIDRRFR
jgi:hypothetical protein